MSSYVSSLLLVFPLLAHSQILSQWYGSTTCGNEGNQDQLSYTSGDDLTTCAAGVYGDGVYHHDFYTRIECVDGGARLKFFPDAACSQSVYSPQDIAANHLSVFRAGGCVPTKSGCCSYRISDMQSMVLPTCLEYPTTTATKITTITSFATTTASTTDTTSTTISSTTSSTTSASTSAIASTTDTTSTTISSTTSSTTSASTSTTEHDCRVLPTSMNGIAHPAGCSGAVWSDGSPSKSYCEGGQDAFPWWSTCCKWDGDACKEKLGTATVATTTMLSQDCTTLPPSMNGALFSAGCSGAVWSDGAPSKSYCQGAQGKFPWWSSCCYWDGVLCKEKEGTAVVTTTTSIYYDCKDLPQSMNGATFASGCAGAVWSNGDPSKTYCEGREGKYPWWAACCKWNEISDECVSRPAGGRRLAVRNVTETIVV